MSTAGHNTLRMESGIGHGVADDEARERLADLVGSAMDAGAFGLSTGLFLTGTIQTMGYWLLEAFPALGQLG